MHPSIRILHRIDPRKPIMVAAWPGMGNVAFGAAIYLKETLNAEKFAEIEPQPKSAKFTITFVGSWGKQRSPKYFLEAVDNLLMQYPALQEHIVVVFVGWVKRDPTMEQWLRERLAQGVLRKTVRLKGFLPHAQALAEMYRADVLLTCNSERIALGGSLASKVFEYMYTGKPILALTAADGDLAYLLNSMDAGVVVLPTNPTLIAQAILQLYEDYRDGTLRGASLELLDQLPSDTYGFILRTPCLTR